MPHKPPPKSGRNVVDPSAYDSVDNATWPPEGHEDRAERDAIRDLEDPTFGFPIGSLAARQERADPEEEPTHLKGGRPPSPTPTPSARRAARIETPTIEFTAYQAPDVPPPSREPQAPRRQAHIPVPAPLRAPPPMSHGVADSAEFEGAPAPIDNSRDDLVDYAEIPGAPPVDVRVVVLLVIFGASVLLLLLLLVVAGVSYLQKPQAIDRPAGVVGGV